MNGHYILDENKNAVPVSFEEWREWYETHTNKHVGDDTINGYRVSTVFLALNHNHWEIGSPLLFETMVFDSKGDTAFDYQERCSTWQEAERQHEEAIRYVLNQKESA